MTSYYKRGAIALSGWPIVYDNFVTSAKGEKWTLKIVESFAYIIKTKKFFLIEAGLINLAIC